MQPIDLMNATVWYFRRSQCLVGREVRDGATHMVAYDITNAAPPYPLKMRFTVTVPLMIQRRDLGRPLLPIEVVLSQEVTSELATELEKNGFIQRTGMQVDVDGVVLSVARLGKSLKTVSAQGAFA